MDFIDSFQFMSSSLESLVGHLAKEVSSQFHHMKERFGEEKLPLLLRKQVYTYDYFVSKEKFAETCLPPHDVFQSSLTGEHVSDEAYAHAQEVWAQF
jgi:hypothetical protein